jgi:periplasmic protein TonB
MTTTPIEERKSQQLGFTFTFFIYLAFLTVLYFLKLVGYPPEDESLGINYGLDLVGYGDIQTFNKASDSKNNYDVKPSDESPKEEPAKKNVVPPTPPKPVEKVEKVNEIKLKEKPVIKSDIPEKSVVIKDNPKPPKEVKSQPVETPPSKPVVKPSPPTPTPPTKTVDRSVDDASSMKKPKGTSNSNGTVGTRDGIGGNNNGDGKKGELGDKGHPDGDIDSKSQMGKPGGKGGGGGSSGGVQISGFGGWEIAKFTPTKDNSDETGKVVLKVVVDGDGKVFSVSVDNSGTTVSPSIAQYYKNQVINNFSKYIRPKGDAPDRSTGTITIVIKN